MVAQRLAKLLIAHNYSVRLLSRKKESDNCYTWDYKNNFIEENALKGVNHIVHLSGAGIADKRWSKARKEEIINSRVETARLLFQKLNDQKAIITSFITASAIGYYGTITSEQIFDESSPKGNDFLSDVCYKWENIADSFNSIAERVVKIRFGVVLSLNGGALPKMIFPVKYYFGAPLGSGNQYMPWIHIDDLCNILLASISNDKMTGVYNGVAPEDVTNKEFTKKIARIIRKPLFLPSVPGWVIKLLYGKRSSILLEGSRVSSEKITGTGFKFNFSTVDTALSDLIRTRYQIDY